MIKKTQAMKVAALCAMAALTMASCQKEQTPVTPHQQEASDQTQAMQFSYAIDGQWYTVTLSDESELRLVLVNLTLMLQDGHRVQIGTNAQPVGSKDVVHYETTDAKQFAEWCYAMTMDGYSVDCCYDKEKGVYVGVATKK